MKNTRLLRRWLLLINIFLYLLLGCAVMTMFLMMASHANLPLRSFYPMITFTLVIILILVFLSAFRKKLKA